MEISLEQSYANRITRHNEAIAQFASQKKTATDDFLTDVERFYEREKEKLIEAFNEIKDKGEEFLTAVFTIIKDFVTELSQDIIRFLKRHGLDEIIEFIKHLF